MPEAKTKLTKASVDDFLETIESDQVRDDCRTTAGIMEKAAKAPPRIWGSSIVGFGTQKCTYAVHMPTLTKLVKSSVALARKSQPS